MMHWSDGMKLEENVLLLLPFVPALAAAAAGAEAAVDVAAKAINSKIKHAI